MKVLYADEIPCDYKVDDVADLADTLHSEICVDDCTLSLTENWFYWADLILSEQPGIDEQLATALRNSDNDDSEEDENVA